MYKLIIILFPFLFNITHAFVTWPNINSPCNGTLQSCIDNSPDGEFIEIRTNDFIDENILTSKPVSIVAGEGYTPVFSQGNNIAMHTNTLLDTFHIVNIKGLTFLGGYVSYIHRGSSDAILNISNNDIQHGAPPNAIRIQLYSTANLSVNVEYNTVARNNTIESGGKTGTIFISKDVLSEGGHITGRVYNNNITAYGELSVGLGIFDNTDGNIEIDVNGNEFYGGGWGALTARKEANSGLMEIAAVSNAFYSAPNSLPYFRGVRINAQTGIVKFHGLNNTILGADEAFLLIDSSNSTLTNNLYNNIMAFGNFAVSSNTNAINNDYNLTYQNQFIDNDFVPGINHVFSNPDVVSMQNGRLKPASPAIDNGSAFAYTGFFDGVKIDADGLLRIKKSSPMAGNDEIDIGAYEKGDLSFVHNHSGTNTHISVINHPALNNMSELDNLHVNSNWNPNNSNGVYNNDNEALYYFSGFWRVFNQNNTDILSNASFNISRFASSENTFEHLASPSENNNTAIDNGNLNGQPNKILHVSQHWKNIYNRHPIGILYAGNWQILNFDLEIIPDGSNFNVYSQDRSKSAWVHRSSNANTTNNFTILSHPLLNGTECANVMVTQSADFGVFNNNPIGVWYTGSHWSIFNQNSAIMPVDAGFHVMINPEQISQCNDIIFKNGFE